MQEFAGSFLVILCYLGYIWTTEKFCKKYLEISRICEKIFVIALFTSGTVINIMNERYPVPYIFFALLRQLFITTIILFLFQGEIEKKILIAAIVITTTTLAGNFCESFLPCLVLFWMHTWKNISVPFLSEWENNLIVAFSLMTEMLAVYGMTKHFRPVLYGKTRKWYLLLAIPLFAVTMVIDMANWGASKGILLRSGGNYVVSVNLIYAYYLETYWIMHWRHVKKYNVMKAVAIRMSLSVFRPELLKNVFCWK